MTNDTAEQLLAAAKVALLDSGYASLSTRKVAAEASVPLSQIHYHFGGKQGLVLALLERENELLIARQRAMYGEDTPLWKRYEQACDYLEDDLASGYVRVLQEMIAAGWSEADVAERVQEMVAGWRETLTDVARASEDRLGGYGPFTPQEVADLVAFAFVGAEALLLLHRDDPAEHLRIVGTLRRIGSLIRLAEDEASDRP